MLLAFSFQTHNYVVVEGAYYLPSSSCFEREGKIRVMFGGRGTEGGGVVVGLYCCFCLAQMHMFYSVVLSVATVFVFFHIFSK